MGSLACSQVVGWVLCDGAKGECLIVIAVLLRAILKNQSVEVGDVWGLIEIGAE